MTDNPNPRRRIRSAALKLHRWLGLSAMAWLVVLGTTGIVLDHPEWRWAKQWTVTEAFGTAHVLEEEAKGTMLRQFQINPDNPSQWLAGGERGLWRSADAGRTWQSVEYSAADGVPALLSIAPLPDAPWTRIFIGTDDGIWVVDGGSGPARRFALAGHSVSELIAGSQDATLVGTADGRRVFSLPLAQPDQISWTDLADSTIGNAPARIGLPRIATDLHFGNGMARGALSTLISDFAGIAIVVLALTGLLQWWLPRRWRRRKQSLSAGTRRNIYRWLFRGHGPVIGLLAIVPIVLLSLSGIFFDHPRALMRTMANVSISSALLPTAFRPKNPAGEIRGLATAPGGWSIMTRLGVLHSADRGATWLFDFEAPLLSHLKGGMIGMSQHDGVTFLGTHGGPNFYRTPDAPAWQPIPNLRMMIQDAQRIGDEWYMKGSGGFIRGSLDGRFTPLDTNLPDVTGMPFYNFLVDLHTGLVFHDQWIWVNDLVAVIAILLAISGLVNWLYRRWI